MLICIAAVAFASLGTQLHAQTRDFAVADHGSLRLAVPSAWQVESRSVREPPSAMLHFTPKSGESFDIQITALWLDAKQRASTNSESIKENTRRAATALLPHSIEKVANVQEIKGSEVVGHFYSLTDSNPGPGEFKYLTQGTFLAGDVLSAFTILSRVSTAPEVTQAIRMFAGAIYLK